MSEILRIKRYEINTINEIMIMALKDRTHSGPAPNKLMPDHVNLETSFVPSTNVNDKSNWKKIAAFQRNADMNLRYLHVEIVIFALSI